MAKNVPTAGHMLTTMLLIVAGGSRSITLHATSDEAWARLVEYVDEHWFEAAGSEAPVDEEARATAFFSGPDDLYVLAAADLSELADSIDPSD